MLETHPLQKQSLTERTTPCEEAICSLSLPTSPTPQTFEEVILEAFTEQEFL
jgi:hypothetical protein